MAAPDTSGQLARDWDSGVPENLQRTRAILAGGAATTVYVARYESGRSTLRLALLRRPAPLEAWCASRGVFEAVVGGFFTRPPQGSGERSAPLGELRTHGVLRRSVPFDAPWDGVRACVHIASGEPRIARRDELGATPRGDLLQAGPLLVRDGARVVDAADDAEGFSAGSGQFDSDITAGRYPRAALALTDEEILTVVCDGRSSHDAGLTLAELADLLVGLGARAAINLDGGGSTSLVCAGALQNRPRAEVGVDLRGGRAVATALVIEPRSG
ncbi:MAG: phosphodiester glycosidase family protein [Solirubrobacteraceae bacterium]